MNSTSTKILVVDDDKDIVNAIAKILSAEGYEIKKAYDGLEAVGILDAEDIKLMLIDVMMPKLDGLSAIMKAREKSNIPIIVISAKTEESDKVLGLSIGADDYISKPFNNRELAARVKSHLRRYVHLGDIDSRIGASGITIGRLSLNKDTKQLFTDGTDAELTATEYKIMELLMSNAGIVFSAEKIYEKVWNDISHSVENTVMVHIRRIREKIEINPGEPEYLKVVWGIGYKIEKNHIRRSK